MSPFRAVHGFEAHVPDAIFGAVAPVLDGVSDSLRRRLSTLRAVRCAVDDTIEQSQTQQRQSANLERVAVSYAVGDLVLLSTKNTLPSYLRPARDQRVRKLLPLWIGPYVVTEVKSNGAAVTLDLPASLSQVHKTFNVDKVRPFVEDDDFPWTVARVDVELLQSIADQREVLRVDVVDGTLEYVVLLADGTSARLLAENVEASVLARWQVESKRRSVGRIVSVSASEQDASKSKSKSASRPGRGLGRASRASARLAAKRA